jgi:hypothetical protein
MKTPLLILILLLSSYAVANSERRSESRASDGALMTSAFWPQDATVRVYFVRGSFTSEQRETLWRTLETLKQGTETIATNRFMYAGETGGLIDCLGCLTLTRHKAHTNDSKRQASFNLLRVDQTGQLSSAWIGFDSAITDSQRLSRLLSRVLQVENSPAR